MNLPSYLALFCAGLCGALASILLKMTASLALPLLSPRVVALWAAALAAYGVSFLLYGYSLRMFNVSTAYVSMVAVAVLALLVYSSLRGESIGMHEIIGAAAVLFGVFLINWKPAAP